MILKEIQGRFQTLTACTFSLLELSERLSPDFSTVNKLHEVGESRRQREYSNESRPKADNTSPWLLAILHSSELSEEEPDRRKALKHMTLKKNRLENGLLSPWHSRRVSISLSAIRGHTRRFKANTATFWQHRSRNEPTFTVRCMNQILSEPPT